MEIPSWNTKCSKSFHINVTTWDLKLYDINDCIILTFLWVFSTVEYKSVAFICSIVRLSGFKKCITSGCSTETFISSQGTARYVKLWLLLVFSLNPPSPWVTQRPLSSSSPRWTTLAPTLSSWRPSWTRNIPCHCQPLTLWWNISLGNFILIFYIKFLFHTSVLGIFLGS